MKKKEQYRRTNFSEKMMPTYTSFAASIVGALSAFSYALKISFDARDHRAPVAHVYLVSLLSCTSTCRCVRGCCQINYSRRRLHCELVLQNQTDSSYLPGRRVGYIHMGMLDELTGPDDECSTADLSICTEPLTTGVITILGNMNTPGSRRLIQCPWGHELDGTNTTTCEPGADWSNYGTCVRVANSTMRDSCTSDSNCFDLMSECRAGHCWCKLGLSHDPDRLSCVELCPGQYGDTFQVVQDHAITGHNYATGDAKDMQQCKTLCLTYSEHVCKYVDYWYKFAGSFYRCHISNHKGSALPLMIAYDGCYFLQRDCASVMK